MTQASLASNLHRTVMVILDRLWLVKLLQKGERDRYQPYWEREEMLVKCRRLVRLRIVKDLIWVQLAALLPLRHGRDQNRAIYMTLLDALLVEGHS